MKKLIVLCLLFGFYGSAHSTQWDNIFVSYNSEPSKYDTRIGVSDNYVLWEGFSGQDYWGYNVNLNLHRNVDFSSNYRQSQSYAKETLDVFYPLKYRIEETVKLGASVSRLNFADHDIFAYAGWQWKDCFVKYQHNLVYGILDAQLRHVVKDKNFEYIPYYQLQKTDSTQWHSVGVNIKYWLKLSKSE